MFYRTMGVPCRGPVGGGGREFEKGVGRRSRGEGRASKTGAARTGRFRGTATSRDTWRCCGAPLQQHTRQCCPGDTQSRISVFLYDFPVFFCETSNRKRILLVGGFKMHAFCQRVAPLLETSTLKRYHSEDSRCSGSRRIEFPLKSATLLQ